MSDKAVPLFPPYPGKEQQVNIKQTEDWVKRGFVGWDRDELFNYFIAGGGSKEEFDYHWNLLIRDGEDILSSVSDHKYYTAGGSVTYLISAKKP